MAIQKPSIPKGTRDFSPTEMVRRNFIFDTIKKVYQKFGFQQIETPAMEKIETLMGKYGDEGDRLIFKILPRGGTVLLQDSTGKEVEIADKVLSPEFVKNTLSSRSPEEALRYDLTVPFARYVVMHQNEITFPFRRYQMQPVWRADRPQKGRYREFYQCDADVIGSTSLLNEVELIQIIDEVFARLGIQTVIKINNRKVLAGIAEEVDAFDKVIDIAIAIDKYDKLKDDDVRKELSIKGISDEKILKIFGLFEIAIKKTKFELSRTYLPDELFRSSTIGKKGMEEINYVLNYFTTNKFLNRTHPSQFKLENEIEWDIKLARGLNYYTGTIIEVKVNDPSSTFTSSICGGGRYDDLTGIFGSPNVSGVGISFGVDRIYDVMDEMKLFDELKLSGATTKILFVNFGNEEEKYCLGLLKQIRDAGINAEIYPDAAKMKKQMGYADDNKIPFVCLVGTDEMKSGQLTLKNMISGEQEKVSIDELIRRLAN